MNTPDNKNSTPAIDPEKFGGLSNPELCMIFHRFKDFKTVLDKNLSNNRTVMISNIPGIGEVPTLASVCQKHVEETMASPFYNMVTAVVDKLKPVVELIEWGDNTLKALDFKMPSVH